VAGACTREGGVDASFSALLRYPTGLTALLHASIRSHPSITASLVGTEGTLEVPDTFLDAAGSLTLVRGAERREIPVAASDRYRQEIEDFSAALQEGRPPLLGLPESIRNLEIIDRLFAAC
jgi:predicted dehydrogenase